MESGAVKISWIIATRNRLPLLQINLERLIRERKPNEEILVADGNSQDGTPAYLEKLYQENKIQGYISGKDRNQSHAWNKLLMMAGGEYIKKMIDDDILDLEAVRQCVREMDTRPEADICISDDMGMGLEVGKAERYSRLPAFREWAAGRVPSFTFGDVHLIIRRSALPLIGLYNPSFIMMDYEYSLRVSYLKAGILYFTGCNALSVSSNQTISSQVSRSQLDLEGIRANTMYEYAGDGADISTWSRIKIRVGKFRDQITGRKKNLIQAPSREWTQEEVRAFYEKATLRLEEENQQHPGTFYFSNGK